MKEKFIIGLFIIALFVTFLGPISDVDFPFHLKTGEFIYTNKEIPKEDPFSFPGKGILNDKKIFILSQYWLAQVIFYKVYSVFGPAGIIILRATIFSSLIFLLWFSIRKRGIYSSLLIAVLSAIILLVNVLDRPQYFSFLFTLILILLLEKFREKPHSPVPLLFIPPLMLIWANMHGGFVFGIAVIFIYTMAEACKFFIKKIIPKSPVGEPLSEKPLLLLLLTGLFSILFSYINPNTNTAILLTFESHTSAKWLFSRVREYMSPLEEASFPYAVKTSNVSFWVLFGLICILTALNTMRKKSIDITTLALLIFSSVAALTAIRYIPFFVAVAIPLIRDYKFFRDTAFLQRLNKPFVVSLLFISFFIFSIGYGLRDYKNIFQFRVHSAHHPTKAIKFLLDNHIEANMFNDINKGSYLLWRLYPHYRVFQDTRYLSPEIEAEGEAIRFALQSPMQSTYMALWSALSDVMPATLGKIEISSKNNPDNLRNSEPFWKQLLKKYNIGLIVHGATSDFTGQIFALTLRLLKDDEWVLIYLDGNVQIFIKNDKKYAKTIEEFKKPKELIYDEIILETSKYVKRRTTFPTAYSSLGFALMMKGMEDDAKMMIDAALELDKKDVIANFCNAYLTLKEKRQ